MCTTNQNQKQNQFQVNSPPGLHRVQHGFHSIKICALHHYILHSRTSLHITFARTDRPDGCRVTRHWKINYPPNEGTQTPANCALTAPPVRRTNWRPSLPRLRGIGRYTRVQAQRAGGLGSYDGPAARAVDSRQEDRNGGSMTIQRRNDDDSAGCRRADPTTRSVV